MFLALGSAGKYGFCSSTGLGLGVGGYNNLFNMDLLASMNITNFSNAFVDFAFTAYPYFNILKTPNNYNKTVHLNLGPYYEWHSKLQHCFGARLGFGWHFSDFSIGVSYATMAGVCFDFRTRINIHLFRL